MKRYLFLLVLALAPCVKAQNTNCNLPLSVYGTNHSTTNAVIKNTQNQCTNWNFSYYTNGLLGNPYNFSFQGAIDNNGSPGTFSDISCTGSTGANPITGGGGAGDVSGNFTFSCYYPWIRISLNLLIDGTITVRGYGVAGIASKGGGGVGPIGPQGPAGPAGPTGTTTIAPLIVKTGTYVVTCTDISNLSNFQAGSNPTNFTMPTCAANSGWVTFSPGPGFAVHIDLATNSQTANTQSSFTNLPAGSGTAGYTRAIFTPKSTTDWAANTYGTGSGTTSPGGSPGQVQWNSAGSFAGFTASGDATINTATGAITFTTVNSNVGTCGDATHVSQVTLNAKGLVTACTPIAITGGSGIQLLSWQVPAADTLTCSVTGSTETPFTTFYAIPASTFVTGNGLHISATFDNTVATSPQFTIKLRIGSTVPSITGLAVYVSTLNTITASNKSIGLSWDIAGTAAASGAANIVTGVFPPGTGPYNANTLSSISSSTLATNGILNLQLTNTCSGSGAGNSIQLTSLRITQ